jgi:hypothetical protein
MYGSWAKRLALAILAGALLTIGGAPANAQVPEVRFARQF